MACFFSSSSPSLMTTLKPGIILTADQDLDLTLGLKIRHFEALSDGYHHPLLPALVAPFAERI